MRSPLILPVVTLLALSTGCLAPPEPPATPQRAGAGDIRVSSDTGLTATAIRLLTPSRVAEAPPTDTPSSFPAGQTVIAAALAANTAMSGTVLALGAATT